MDMRKVNLNHPSHAKVYMYGIGRFYNGLDLLSPYDDLQQVQRRHMLDYSHDLKFSVTKMLNNSTRDLKGFRDAIINGS